MNTGEGFFFFPCEINFKIFKNIHFPGSSFIYVIQTWHKPDNQCLHSAWVLEPSRLEDPPDCSVCSTEHWIQSDRAPTGSLFDPHTHISPASGRCALKGPSPFLAGILQPRSQLSHVPVRRWHHGDTDVPGRLGSSRSGLVPKHNIGYTLIFQ